MSEQQSEQKEMDSKQVEYYRRYHAYMEVHGDEEKYKGKLEELKQDARNYAQEKVDRKKVIPRVELPRGLGSVVDDNTNRLLRRLRRI